jgi:hypothetical protein
MMPRDKKGGTKGDEGGIGSGVGSGVGGGVDGKSIGVGGGGGIGSAHTTNPLFDRAQSKSKLLRLASMRTQSQVAHTALQEAQQRQTSMASATSAASPAPATRASVVGAGDGAGGGAGGGRDFTLYPACIGSAELTELANNDARLSKRKVKVMRKHSSIAL